MDRGRVTGPQVLFKTRSKEQGSGMAPELRHFHQTQNVFTSFLHQNLAKTSKI